MNIDNNNNAIYPPPIAPANINPNKNYTTLLNLLQKNFGDNDTFDIDANIYQEYLKSNSDNGFVAYMKNLKTKKSTININDIINCNGVTYGIIKDIPTSLRKDIIQCESCQKYYIKNMVTYVANLEGNYCYHCVYMLNYCNIQEADGKYEKKVVPYIMECKNFHDTNTCNLGMIGSCIICDHLNGKKIWGLEDDDLLNGNIDIPDSDIYTPDSEYVLELVI